MGRDPWGAPHVLHPLVISGGLGGRVRPRLEDRLAASVRPHHRPDRAARGAARRPALERDDERAQQPRQGALLGGVEAGEERLLPRQQAVQGPVDGDPTRHGQPDQDPAPVVRVGRPPHQAASRQPVDAVGHRAARDQSLLEQPPGRELVRRPGPAQRGQHVELPRLEGVLGERLSPGPVEVVAEPADPAEHLHRPKVEVGALPAPGLDEPVHLVPHGPILAVEILDIETLSHMSSVYTRRR
jgi:hypothetical protein